MALAGAVTVNTVGLAAVGAVAIAGAVGLGIAGLASLAFRRRGNRYHGSGYGYSHGHGHSGGYGYGHHRRRRSLKHKRTEEEELEEIMQQIRAQDVTGCGKRLVCDLAAKEENRLTIEELSILKLVGKPVVDKDGVLPKGAATEYKMARVYGESGGDCRAAFPHCPASGPQLMEMVMASLP